MDKKSISTADRRKIQVREANQRKRCKQKLIEKIQAKHNIRDCAFNLNLLVDGWLELESDPGTFTLLLEDFGCFGAQVEEVYDLDQKFDDSVYGFIFLFRWLHPNHNQKQNSKNSNSPFINVTQPNVTPIKPSSTIAINSSINPSPQKQDASALKADTDSSAKPKEKTAPPVPAMMSTRSSSCASYSMSQRQDPITGQGNFNNSNNSLELMDNNQQAGGDLSYVHDESIISSMFFAKQMISNSCATHALLSILLNCDHKDLSLGPVLTRLKEHTKVMNSENKGLAIGNLPELAKAHNSHASYLSLYNKKEQIAKQANSNSYVISGNQRTNLQQQQHEAYHFVSYIPIKGRLYELDGLKDAPIDHGPVGSGNNWVEKFGDIIKKRVKVNDESGETCSDIRYSLMAVVPDKRIKLNSQLKHLKENRDIIEAKLKLIAHQESSQQSLDNDIPNPPYSPLSTGTLTASESGSAFNSPTRCEENLIPDDKIERFVLIKLSNKSADENNAENGETVLETTIIPPSIPPALDSIFFPIKESEGSESNIELLKVYTKLELEIEKLEVSLKEEMDKRKQYIVDDSRRTHNYEPFIISFLAMLAQQGNLADLLEEEMTRNDKKPRLGSTSRLNQG